MRIWPAKGWAAVRRWQWRGSGAAATGAQVPPAWRGGGRHGGRRLHCTGRRVEGVEGTDGPRWIWEGCACWSREAPAVVDVGCRADLASACSPWGGGPCLHGFNNKVLRRRRCETTWTSSVGLERRCATIRTKVLHNKSRG